MNEPTSRVRASIRPGWEYHLASIAEGLWCDHCSLPSRLVARMILVDRARPDVWMAVSIFHHCRDCGRQRYTPGDLSPATLPDS